jgi:hypothetical protein
MESVANMLIAAFDLAEAEGRAAHRGVIRLLVRAAAIVGAGVLGLIGLLLVAWGIYEMIALLIGGDWGHVWAALICGAILLGAAAGAFLYGRVPPPGRNESKIVKDPYAARNDPSQANGNGHGNGQREGDAYATVRTANAAA